MRSFNSRHAVFVGFFKHILKEKSTLRDLNLTQRKTIGRATLLTALCEKVREATYFNWLQTKIMKSSKYTISAPWLARVSIQLFRVSEEDTTSKKCS